MCHIVFPDSVVVAPNALNVVAVVRVNVGGCVVVVGRGHMPAYLVIDLLQGVLLFLLIWFLIACIVLCFASAIWGYGTVKSAFRNVVATMLDHALLLLRHRP